VSAEHGAGDGVRPEGVLHRRRQGSAGRGGARWGCRRGRCGGGCRACRGCSPSCRSLRRHGEPGAAGAADPAGAAPARQGVPLVRARRRLPRILEPGEVDALTAALRTHRDRAMVAAMVLGGLRRCEVLGLRLEDVRVGQRRMFVAEGKGRHQRLVPVSGRFFTAVAAYLASERPDGADTDRVFVVLKGPRRGLPLTAAGGGRSAGRRPPSAKVTTPGPPGTSAPRRGWRTRYSGRRPNSVSDRVGQVPAHTTTRCSARDRASWRGWSRRRRGSAR